MNDSFFNQFKTLDSFDEQDADWEIEKWVPKEQITLIGSDGGVGKTSLWISILAARSAGKRCFLDPPEYECEPQLVAFLTTEDSIRKKLKRRLRLAGADMSKIITPDFSSEIKLLEQMKFGSDHLAGFIRYFKPSICVFDPIQGFVPPNVNMGARNEMRNCMAPLVALGEETGCTSIILCHTNKRKGAYGRDRLADSADAWDISRSVIMMDYAEEQGVRYISQEKSNYGELQETVLFRIDGDGIINKVGTTWKHDREFQQNKVANLSPQGRQECKDWILSTLQANREAIPSKKFEQLAKDQGFSFATFRRAKEELKDERKLRNFQSMSTNGSREWYTQLLP